MQLFHTRPVASAVFDEPNLVSAAGLVPLMALARRAGLAQLADRWLSVPTDKGANAGVKVCSLVAGMAAGADSIDDMAVLRHGGMARVLGAAPAPSTLGSFLRAMTFGHYADPRIMPSWWRPVDVRPGQGREVSDEVGIIPDGVSLLLRGLGPDEERRNEESTAIAPAGGRSTRTVGGRTTR